MKARHKPVDKTKALVALLVAADNLMEIVEGERNVRWACPSGGRLTDTKEWCDFYVKWCVVHRDAFPNE